MAHAHGRYLSILGHEMVREHVLGTKPAWVFTPDGQEILWSNAAGLTFLDVKNLAALARYRGAASSPVTRRIAQLAARKQGFRGGLERFRFFVGVRAKPAACLCQPLTTVDDEHCVLVVAIDAPSARGDGPGQSLVRHFQNAGLAAALMDASGEIIASTTAFADRYQDPENGTWITEETDNSDLISILTEDGSTRLIIADETLTETPGVIAASAEALGPEDGETTDAGSENDSESAHEEGGAALVAGAAIAAGTLLAASSARADETDEQGPDVIPEVVDGDAPAATRPDHGDVQTGDVQAGNDDASDADVDTIVAQPPETSPWHMQTAGPPSDDTAEDLPATGPETDDEIAAPGAVAEMVAEDLTTDAVGQTAEGRDDKPADPWMTAAANVEDDGTLAGAELPLDNAEEKPIGGGEESAAEPWMTAAADNDSDVTETSDPAPDAEADLEAGETDGQTPEDDEVTTSSPDVPQQDGPQQDGPQQDGPQQDGMSADMNLTEAEAEGIARPDPETPETATSDSLSDAISRLSVPLLGPDAEDGGRKEPGRLAPENSDDGPDEPDSAERASPVPPIEPQETFAAEPGFDFVPRRAPHRFVWEMDETRQFSMVTPDLADAIGPTAADIVGKTWQQTDDALALENSAIASAIEAGETWTGMRVDWPVEGTDQMVPVELTALPIYDQNRKFAGYRGFGVCRTDRAKPDPMARGQQLAQARISRTQIAREISESSPSQPTLTETDDDESHHAGALAQANPIDRSVFVTPSLRVVATNEAATTKQQGSSEQSGDAGAVPETHKNPESSARADSVDATENDDRSNAGVPAKDAEAKPIKGLIAGLAGAALSALGMSASSREASADEPASQAVSSDLQEDLAGQTEDPADQPEDDAAGSDVAATHEPEIETPEPTDQSGQIGPENAVVEAISPAPVFSSKEILALFIETPTPNDEREAFAGLCVDKTASDGNGDQSTSETTEPSPTSNEDSAANFTTTEREDGSRQEVGETASEQSPVSGRKYKDTSADSQTGAEKPDLPPSAANVIAMVPGSGSEPNDSLKRLSRPEREAFQQIAQALGARLEGDDEDPPAEAAEFPGRPTIEVVEPDTPVVALPSAFATGRRDVPEGILLDRLPTGVLLCRGADVLFANRAALDLLEYVSSSDLRNAGGLEAIFAEEGDSHAPTRSDTAEQAEAPGRPITIRARSGTMKSLFARLYSVPWANDRALMIVFEPLSRGQPRLKDVPMGAAAPALSFDAARKAAGRERIEELESILDTATDGVLVLTADGTIDAANRSAEALFAADRKDMIGSSLTDYLALESHRSALDYLDGLARNGVESVLNDGREVIGQETSGGLIPMFMTIGRVNRNEKQAKFCAVLRDITQWKKAEEDLTSARRQAETASSQKSDFLAKISHEIRTPLNAIIGFSEVMLGERLGPIGTERYKEYLHDIRWSGDYIMSLINDLLDLSKIEAGKMDLTFEAVSVNDILKNCVALLQPEANRERIIIRTSLSESVPNVVADARSVQQIVLNLLSNAIKFNKRGGQVIVSTVYSEDGDVNVRVRDTGIGMSDEDLRLALEPFRQIQTTRSSAGGTGLGLPLTKALVEANRANFMIDSKPQEGTMVEITFPSPRVLAE